MSNQRKYTASNGAHHTTPIQYRKESMAKYRLGVIHSSTPVAEANRRLLNDDVLQRASRHEHRQMIAEGMLVAVHKTPAKAKAPLCAPANTPVYVRGQEAIVESEPATTRVRHASKGVHPASKKHSKRTAWVKGAKRAATVARRAKAKAVATTHTTNDKEITMKHYPITTTTPEYYALRSAKCQAYKAMVRATATVARLNSYMAMLTHRLGMYTSLMDHMAVATVVVEHKGAYGTAYAGDMRASMLACVAKLAALRADMDATTQALAVVHGAVAVARAEVVALCAAMADELDGMTTPTTTRANKAMLATVEADVQADVDTPVTATWNDSPYNPANWTTDEYKSLSAAAIEPQPEDNDMKINKKMTDNVQVRELLDTLPQGDWYITGDEYHKENITKEINDEPLCMDVKGYPQTLALSNKPDAKCSNEEAHLSYNRAVVYQKANGELLKIHGCATGIPVKFNMLNVDKHVLTPVYEDEKGSRFYFPFGMHWIVTMLADKTQGTGQEDMSKTKKYSRHMAGFDIKISLHGKEVSYGPQPVDHDLKFVMRDNAGIFCSELSDGALWCRLSHENADTMREAVQAKVRNDAWVVGLRRTGYVDGYTNQFGLPCIAKGAMQRLAGLWLDDSDTDRVFSSDDNYKSATACVAGLMYLADTFSKVKGGNINGQVLGQAEIFLDERPQIKELIIKALMNEEISDIDQVTNVINSASILAKTESVVKAIIEAYRAEYNMDMTEEEADAMAESMTLDNALVKEIIVEKLSSRAGKHRRLNFGYKVSNMLSVTMDIYGILEKEYIAINCKSLRWKNFKDGDIILTYRSPVGTPGGMVAVRVIDVSGDSKEAELIRAAYGDCYGRVIMAGGVREIMRDHLGVDEIGSDRHEQVFRQLWTQNYEADVADVVANHWDMQYSKSIQVRFGGMDYDNDTIIISNCLRSLTEDEVTAIYDVLKLTDHYAGIDAEALLDGSVSKMELNMENQIQFFNDRAKGKFGATVGVSAVTHQNLGLLIYSVFKDIIEDYLKEQGLPVGRIGDNPDHIKALTGRSEIADWEADCNINLTCTETIQQGSVDKKAVTGLVYEHIGALRELIFGATIVVRAKDEYGNDYYEAFSNCYGEKGLVARQVALRGFGPGMGSMFCNTPDTEDQDTWFSMIATPGLMAKLRAMPECERVIEDSKVKYLITLTSDDRFYKAVAYIKDNLTRVDKANFAEHIEELFMLDGKKLPCADTMASRLFDMVKAQIDEKILPLIVEHSVEKQSKYDMPAEFKTSGNEASAVFSAILKDDCKFVNKDGVVEFPADDDRMIFNGLTNRKALNNMLKFMRMDQQTTDEDVRRVRRNWQDSWLDAFSAYTRLLDKFEGNGVGINMVGTAAMSFISGHTGSALASVTKKDRFVGRHPVIFDKVANVGSLYYLHGIFDKLIDLFVNRKNNGSPDVIIRAIMDENQVDNYLNRIGYVTFGRTSLDRISLKTIHFHDTKFYPGDRGESVSFAKAFSDPDQLWVAVKARVDGKFVYFTLKQTNGHTTVVMPEANPEPQGEEVIVEETYKNELRIEDNLIVGADSGDKRVHDAIRAWNGIVFLTGEGGTGKSYLINQIMDDSYAICASTGIAATHIGGKTVHSFIGWKGFEKTAADWLDNMSSNHRLMTWWDRCHGGDIRSAKVIVVDEVSMLNHEMMRFMDIMMRTATNKNLPFGGKKIIFTGDFSQLEPIEKDAKGNSISNPQMALDFIKSLGLKVLTVNLEVPHRQTDEEFLTMLRRVKRGVVVDQDIEKLMTRKGEFTDAGVTLYGKNDDVDVMNDKRMREKCDMSTAMTDRYVMYKGYMGKRGPIKERPLGAQDKTVNKGGYPTLAYAAAISLMKDLLTPKTLTVAMGARVMITKNNEDLEIVNGDLGTVLDLGKNHITVEVDRTKKVVEITRVLSVKEYKEKYSTELVIAEHFPIKLGYAFTVHKSQGMSIPKVNIGLNDAFACGQMYVALSRCTSFEGITLAPNTTPEGLKKAIKLFRQETRDWENEMYSVEHVANMISSGVDRDEVLAQLKERDGFVTGGKRANRVF